MRKDETREAKALRKKNQHKTPIEEKESFRWLEGYRETIEAAKRNSNTTCICVGDSESDIFAVFAERKVANAHVLVRACQDRNIESENAEFTNIRAAAYSSSIVATKVLHVRARPATVLPTTRKRAQARTTREAFLEIRKVTVVVKAPEHPRTKKGSVTLNVVLVSESSPPAGETAVEWILLTTLPIETLDDVLKVIEYYECRWMIEIFFKTLKSGCGVQSLQFEETSRLGPCLGVYLIVTWRVLFVCRLGRSHPDWSCEILFDAAEWKSTYRVMHPKKALPKKPPSLGEMMPDDWRVRRLGFDAGQKGNARTTNDLDRSATGSRLRKSMETFRTRC